MWLLPIRIFLVTVALAIPLGLYMAWIFDGRFRAPPGLRWLEERLDTGPQNWKQYALALLLFNVAIFVVGFAILALQPLPAVPQSRRQGDARADDDLQHRLLVPDQHQPAALLGRSAPLVLQPAVLHLLEAVRHAGDRPVRPGGDHPRPARRQAHGQLLPRPVARRSSTSSCRWRSSWPCC